MLTDLFSISWSDNYGFAFGHLLQIGYMAVWPVEMRAQGSSLDDQGTILPIQGRLSAQPMTALLKNGESMAEGVSRTNIVAYFEKSD